MHYLVRLLVKADDEKEALSAAERDAEDLVEQGEFDWYDFDGRWGRSKAYRSTSKKGKELIETGIQYRRDDFDNALKTIRYMLDNYTDDQIFNEEFDKVREALDEDNIYVSRHAFWNACSYVYNGPYVIAADGNLWGSVINNKRELGIVLEQNKTEKLWVVPVDFHN